MAVAQGYGKTVTSGSVFAYDTGDTRNSYRGRPTTNLSTGYTLYNYNNVPGNVTTTITTTGGTYKGAAVWRQTITPLDSTGVSYLTNGNNPGIGVYHGGGGGTGGQYSGHTIFFKPVGPMYSSPIFTAYSNIGGWQSNGEYEDMGDGWFRAKVLWYYPSTLSDQKFWAINPSGATTNVPITIDWAGPFKEDLNSTTISQFVEGTRSATQGLLPLVGSPSLDLSNVSFNSNSQITFDGTNDYINTNYVSSYNGTVEMVLKSSDYNVRIPFSLNSDGYSSGPNIYFTGNTICWNIGDGGTNYFSNSSYPNSNFHHLTITNETSGATLYIDGVLVGTATSRDMTTTGNNKLWIGGYHDGGYYYNGEIPVMKLYNRALSAAEVKQNYLHYKTRFNLS